MTQAEQELRAAAERVLRTDKDYSAVTPTMPREERVAREVAWSEACEGFEELASARAILSILDAARAAQAAAEEKLMAAEAQKEYAMTRLRESAAFWKQRSDHEYHKPNYPKADRYDAKREALEDVLADLESAASREDANDGR